MQNRAKIVRFSPLYRLGLKEVVRHSFNSLWKFFDGADYDRKVLHDQSAGEIGEMLVECDEVVANASAHVDKANLGMDLSQLIFPRQGNIHTMVYRH